DSAREYECRAGPGKNRDLAHNRSLAVSRSERQSDERTRLQVRRPGDAVSLQDHRITCETHFYRFGRNRVAHDQLSASWPKGDNLPAALPRWQLSDNPDISSEDLSSVQSGIHVGSLTILEI